MKSIWTLLASIVQLVFGLAAVVSYFIIASFGEDMLKWTVTLVLAIGFIVIGVIGIVDWVKAKKQ